MRAGAYGTIAATALLMASAGPVAAQDGMPSFSSDAELKTFLNTRPPAVEAPPPPPPPPPPPIYHHRPVPGGDRPAGPVQHDPPGYGHPVDLVEVAGVDAGDLVQAVGDHLVILRRGRLYSVATAGDQLRTVDVVDAFPPGAVALRDWSEQMFAVGDMVAVVAFSAARGGTEISRFRVSPSGELSWVDTHQLHRGESRHSATARLVDGRLVFHTAAEFDREGGGDLLRVLPRVDRWTAEGFVPGERLVDAGEVHVPTPLKALGGGKLSMEAVTHCDIAGPAFACDAVAALAPRRQEMHIAADATYVWTNRAGDWSLTDPAWIYRIPHDGGAPAAIQVFGFPAHAAGFGVTPDGNHLQVLVKRPREGDEGDAPDFMLGRPALLRVDLDQFGDGSRAAPEADYLPLPGEPDVVVRAAAMPDSALLFSQKAWNPGDHPARLVAVAAHTATAGIVGEAPYFNRITPAGSDAVVAGASSGLPFNVVDLDAAGGPVMGPPYVQTGTSEAETRNHAFRYRPDADAPDGERGLLALPVGAALTPLDILFLRRDGLELSEAGRLSSTRRAMADDGCRASCAAWYRNARAVFIGERIFALLGYELVEGEMTPDGRLREVRRLDFAPPAPEGEGA